MTRSQMVENLVKENDALKNQNSELSLVISELRESNAALMLELDAAASRIAALEVSGPQNHGTGRN